MHVKNNKKHSHFVQNKPFLYKKEVGIKKIRASLQSKDALILYC